MINCNTKESGAKLEGVIRADKSEIRSHVAERVRQSVEETLAEFYPEAAWQRCMVHRYRNVLTAVPKSKAKLVTAMRSRGRVLLAAADRRR